MPIVYSENMGLHIAVDVATGYKAILVGFFLGPVFPSSGSHGVANDLWGLHRLQQMPRWFFGVYALNTYIQALIFPMLFFVLRLGGTISFSFSSL
jgi:hypothetical protein